MNITQKMQNAVSPEDFANAGLSFHDPQRLDVNAGLTKDEYLARIRANLPTRAPEYKVGESIYNFLTGGRTPVSRVSWDRGIGKWRYLTPGLSTVEPY